MHRKPVDGNSSARGTLQPLARLPALPSDEKEAPHVALQALKSDLGGMKDELKRLENEQRMLQESQLAAAREKLRQKKRSDLARRLLEAQRLQVVLQRKQEEEEEKRSKVSKFKAKMQAIAESSLKRESVLKERLNFGTNSLTPAAVPNGRRQSLVHIQEVPDQQPDLLSVDRSRPTVAHASTENDALNKERASMSKHLASMRHLHTQKSNAASFGESRQDDEVKRERSDSLAAFTSQMVSMHHSSNPIDDGEKGQATLELLAARHELQQLIGEDSAATPGHVLEVLDRIEPARTTVSSSSLSPLDEEAATVAFNKRVEEKYQKLEEKEKAQAQKTALREAGIVLRDDRIVSGDVVQEDANANEAYHKAAEKKKSTVTVRVSIAPNNPINADTVSMGTELLSPTDSEPPSYYSSPGARHMSIQSVLSGDNLNSLGGGENLQSVGSAGTSSRVSLAGDVSPPPGGSSVVLPFAFDKAQQEEHDRTALQHSQMQQRFAAGIAQQKEVISNYKQRLAQLEQEEKEAQLLHTKESEEAAHSNDTDKTEVDPNVEERVADVAKEVESPANTDKEDQQAHQATAEIDTANKDDQEPSKVGEVEQSEDFNGRAAAAIQKTYRNHRARVAVDKARKQRNESAQQHSIAMVKENADAIREIIAVRAERHPTAPPIAVDVVTPATPDELDDDAIDNILAQQEALIDELSEQLLQQRAQDAAATKIQAQFRRHRVSSGSQATTTARRTRIQDARQHEAAVLIQQQQRGRQARKMAKTRQSLHERYSGGKLEPFACTAAKCLQTHFRKLLAKRRAERLKRAGLVNPSLVVRDEAALLIQNQWRMRQSRKHTDARRSMRKQEMDVKWRQSEEDFKNDKDFH